MALRACPQCGHMVSPAAVACPACGHPIAKSTGNGGMGCLIVVIIIIVSLSYAVHEGENIESAEKLHPTCVTNYRLCKDNADLVEHHRPVNGIKLSIECKTAAEEAARYGDPDIPFFGFGYYYTGHSYIDTGVAVLIEKDAKFKNVFGTPVSSTVVCSYDLTSHRASVNVTPH